MGRGPERMARGLSSNPSCTPETMGRGAEAHGAEALQLPIVVFGIEVWTDESRRK